MSSLGTRIGDARGDASKSKAEVARLLGVDVKTVYRWEHDLSEPESKQVVPLADALGVSVRWLLTGAEDEGPAESLEATGTDG